MWNTVDNRPKKQEEIVIYDINGNFVSPVTYSAKFDCFLCSQGTLRAFMISKWAYKSDVIKTLGLQQPSQKERLQLNKRAEEELLLEQQHAQNDQSFVPVFAGHFSRG